GDRDRRDPDSARRGPDGALPARAARSRPQGGPSPHRDRVRRVGAHRQSRRRGQAEVLLHLLLRPEAPRGARRGRAPATAGGGRPHRRPVRPAPDDRLGARQPRVAVRGRARRRRHAAALAGGPDARRRDAPADAGVLPPHASQREVGDGDRADDPVGLPRLPHRAQALPVLRREGGVPLLRHQPQLAPAQAGRASVHGRKAGRGRDRGARADRPVRHRTRVDGVHPHRRLGHEHRRRPRGGRLLRPVRAGDRGALPRALDRQGGRAGAAARGRPALQGLRDHDLPPELRGLGQAALRDHLARQGAVRRTRGMAPPDPRRGRGVRPALRDPELRRGRRDGEAVRVRLRRRGDRLYDGGAGLLHEPRRHPALHDVVPGADDAARPRQPARGAARVPHPPARLLPRGARPPRARTAAGLRPAGPGQRRLLRQLLHGYVDAVTRITVDEARELWLHASDDELRRRAQEVRGRYHEPKRATYMVMRIINYTNVCVAQCDYCAFYVLPNRPGGYVLSRDEVFAKIDELLEVGGDLVGFNGGFNPKLPLDYYCDLFAAVRERYGDRVEFYALTIAEFVYLADRASLSFADAAARLRDAGVHWVTGGGSEILTEDFRARHAKFKYTVRDYFDAQRAIVESGMRTTATMVIGFDETLDERLEHLQRTRDFQDACLADGLGGLFSFLCWTYKPYGTAFGGREIEPRE